jgi:fumarate hydratase class I
MHDIAHYLRPAHLHQLRKIIDDPEVAEQRSENTEGRF